MSILSGILGGGGVNTSSQQKKIGTLAGQTAGLGTQLQGVLSDADRTGVWNPDQNLAQLKADTLYSTGLNAGNAAAASRILGYRPGDTAPIQQQQAIQNGAAMQYAQQANALRQNSILGRLSAYGSTLGQVGNFYGQAGSLYGQQAGLSAQQQQSQGGGLSSLLGAVSPFLLGGATGGASLLAGGAAKAFSPSASFNGSTAPLGPNVPVSIAAKDPGNYLKSIFGGGIGFYG